jgi:hypothetical protein
MECEADPMTRPVTEPERLPLAERRCCIDRRNVGWRTFVQGGLTPRRRGGRRAGESDQLIDWHEPHLLALALSILLLSVADAFLTLTLMMNGAQEVNPVLDYVLATAPELFAAVKMGLTGAGVVVLVAIARATVFRLIKASSILHGCLLVYLTLIAYEWWMIEQL